MIELFHQQISLSPSMRALVGRIVGNVSERFNQLVLCPRQVNRAWLADSILAELHRSSFAFDEIDARRFDSSTALAKTIAHHFGCEGGSAHRGTLDHLLEHLDGLNAVNIIGVEEVAAERRREWFELLRQWSRAVHAALDRGLSPPAVLCVTRVDGRELEQFEPEHQLQVHWWWNLPSGLEFRLLCRAAEPVDGDAIATQWREHLAMSLASADAEFLAEIWTMLVRSKSELLGAVRRFSAKREWTADSIHDSLNRAATPGLFSGSLQITSNHVALLEPPPNLRRLWADGLIYHTPEFGCELHTSALAVIGASSVLEQRLWRAQASMILPWLDSVRHHVCRHLADKFGRNWPTRWCRPESEEEFTDVANSHLACQWGYLRHLLATCPRFRSQRRLLPLAEYARRLRNELAHNRPVELTDLNYFSQEYQRNF
jgi:hypothetical protein